MPVQTSAVPVPKPEDWPQAFTERLAAGDLDGLVALYESDARFVAPSGETIVGRAGMRAVLAALIASRTRLRSRVVRAVIAGEIAVLYTDFDGESQDGAGRSAPMQSRAIEILRRRADGTWGLIVGDPNGRA